MTASMAELYFVSIFLAIVCLLVALFALVVTIATWPRCVLCGRRIWPWQHYGFRGETQWHAQPCRR